VKTNPNFTSIPGSFCHRVSFSLWLLLAALPSFLTQPPTLLAQGTAFTYQGRLTDGGTPFAGNAEFQPTLWDAVSGGNQVAANTPATVTASLTNGLFVLPLDFGVSPFNAGADGWLQFDLRTALGPFTTLAPRQRLTPTPYAITAGNVTSNGISGTYVNAVTFDNAGNSFTGNGSGLTSLNASRLSSGTVPNARIPATVARTNDVWLLGGNVGADPTNNFIGTADYEPLEIRANGRRALRVEWAGDSNEDIETEDDGSVNLLGGAPTNSMAPGVVGSVIGGGGAAKLTYVSTGGPYSITAPNRVSGDYEVIGGGAGNTASNSFSAVGGGNFNTASGYGSTVAGGVANTAGGSISVIGGGGGNGIDGTASSSTIAGGQGNQVFRSATSSTIGGGRQNTVFSNVVDSVIGGGAVNRIDGFIGAGGHVSGATISGGVLNTIQPGADYATIAGGRDNIAGGLNSFAAGAQAQAIHDGSFVWAGGATKPYATTLTSSFNVYAAGGMSFDYGSQSDSAPRGARWVYIGPDSIGNTIATSSGARLTDGGVWSNASDKHRKTDFMEVDARAVLDKLAALPVRQWRYTNETAAVKHLGPTAQDFQSAFGLGTDDESIGTVDADGVALAAIQGLNQKVEVRMQNADARYRRLEDSLQQKEAEIANLKQIVSELKELVQAMSPYSDGGAR
jgi:trimeric autotransporter adhesin